MANANIEMTNRAAKAPSEDDSDLDSVDRDVEKEIKDSEPLLEGSDTGFDEHDNKVSSFKLSHHTTNPRQRLLWKNCRASWLVLAIAVSIFAIGSGAAIWSLFRYKPNSRIAYTSQLIGSHWHGFSTIQHYFAFGDSWTDTHTDAGGTPPSTDNPIGNPAFPGRTSSNGANYIGYLTATYNHSFIKTYDFAFSGSTIDATIDHPMMNWLDFSHQLKDEFIKYHTINQSGILLPKGEWTSENSLFSTFFGINDVMVFDRQNPQLERLFSIYESLIGELYDASARNFLLINVPAIELSPSITIDHTDAQKAQFKSDVQDFNGLISTLASHLRHKYSDITIFEFDAHDLFERVIHDPKSVPQTASYKEVMAVCEEYKNLEFGDTPTEKQIELCGGLRMDEYLWLNSLHVTWPVHDAMAAGIEKLLLGSV